MWAGDDIYDPVVSYNTCVTLVELAHEYEFDDTWDRVVAAQAWQESRLNPFAVGAAGEVGVLQVSPQYHCEDACTLDDALEHLVELMDEYSLERSHMYSVLCHYNAGNLCNDGSYDYASSVRSIATRIRENLLTLNVCRDSR